MSKSDTATITLMHPIVFEKGHGEKAERIVIETLELRRPTVGDYMSAEKIPGDVGRTTAMIASMTGHRQNRSYSHSVAAVEHSVVPNAPVDRTNTSLLAIFC